MMNSYLGVMGERMEQNYPILYSFRRCPYAMRARLALYLAKIPHEHREVDLKNKPVEMLKISPKGTVPVLQLPDKTVLEESLDIMIWALKRSPLSPEEKKLIEENDSIFKKSIDRYKYPDRYSQEDSLYHRQLCTLFVAMIEDQLSPFLSGHTIGLTDMALFPFVRQFAGVDSDWFKDQPFPRLKQWLDHFEESTLFQNVMEKYPTWSPDDEPCLINFSNSE